MDLDFYKIYKSIPDVKSEVDKILIQKLNEDPSFLNELYNGVYNEEIYTAATNVIEKKKDDINRKNKNARFEVARGKVNKNNSNFAKLNREKLKLILEDIYPDKTLAKYHTARDIKSNSDSSSESSSKRDKTERRASIARKSVDFSKTRTLRRGGKRNIVNKRKTAKRRYNP